MKAMNEKESVEQARAAAEKLLEYLENTDPPFDMSPNLRTLRDVVRHFESEAHYWLNPV